MGARKRASIGAPPPLENKKIHIHVGAFFAKWGPFFSLLRPCLGLPLLQISVGVHGREQSRCRTATKATQIHGASNVMFVYALQKPETATEHTIPYHNRCS